MSDNQRPTNTALMTGEGNDDDRARKEEMTAAATAALNGLVKQFRNVDLQPLLEAAIANAKDGCMRKTTSSVENEAKGFAVSPIHAVVNSAGDIIALSQKIGKNDTNSLWDRNRIKRIESIDEEEKRLIINQAENLMTESKLEINAQELKELMMPNPDMPGIHAIYRDWATCLVVQSANLATPDFGETFGEMLLQQSVYVPISQLLNAFSHAIAHCKHRSKYKADQHVHCFPLVEGKNINKNYESVFYRVEFKPDAAVTFDENYFVLAMMEIKIAGVSIDDVDSAKCVVATSLSALALHNAAQDSKETLSYPIYFPFVIGRGELVTLYVTRLDEKGKLGVYRVSSSLMTDQRGKIMMVAALAVLLSWCSKAFASLPLEYWTTQCAEFSAEAKDHDNLGSASSKKRDNDDSSSLPKSSQNKKQQRQQTGGPKALDTEELALSVASHSGKVQNLQYPWRRFGVLNLGSSTPCKPACQVKSPFYFKGETSGTGTDVFCKVWRVGDSHTDRESIVEEIKYLKMANKNGVPSPKVMDEFTALDVVHYHERETFHVLVTQLLPQDKVQKDDVHDFAVSLIRSVQELHKAGMLHCDIKPANVSWDSKTRRVSLLDFGHAQLIEGATSYKGTRGFTAPEVINLHPHDQASDTYSVGKTLDKIIEDCYLSEQHNDNFAVLISVVKGLTLECPNLRMALKEAEEKLAEGMTTQSPVHKRLRPADLATVSPESLTASP